MALFICLKAAALLLSVVLIHSFNSGLFNRHISAKNLNSESKSSARLSLLSMSVKNSSPLNDDDEDNENNTNDKGGFLIKEIDGGDNQKTGQFIVNKKGGDGDLVPLFAFSTPPAPLNDSLIVVGATMGGLLSMVLVFLFANKDIVPFPSN